MDNGLTINDVAMKLGVSYTRVLQIIKQGDLETYKLPGRRTRIKPSEFSRYVKKRESAIQ